MPPRIRYMGNPKVMIFFLALLPTVVDLSAVGVTEYFQIAAAMCVILTSVLSAYALAAMRTRRLFKHCIRRSRFTSGDIWRRHKRRQAGRSLQRPCLPAQAVASWISVSQLLSSARILSSMAVRNPLAVTCFSVTNPLAFWIA